MLEEELEMIKKIIWLIIGSIIFVGCTLNPGPLPTVIEDVSVYSTQIIQPSEIPEFEPTTGPQISEIASARNLRIRITTTSDWTRVKLIAGAILDDYEIISSSTQAGVAHFDQDLFILEQPIDQAEVGQSVEMIADLSITEESLAGDLVFEIDRGHIGMTTVEISNFHCGQPGVIETFTWDGIQPSGENFQRFTIPIIQLFEPAHNEYIVIAQHNFWYFGPKQGGGFGDGWGNRETPLNPYLGDYWSSDPDVMYQQIEWAVEYGVDAFSIEWTTPRGVGCCVSMEETLDDVFLK